MADNVVRTVLAAFLRVDGRMFRCSNVTLNYSVNAIPDATVSLASGRDMRTLETSAIHDPDVNFTGVTEAQIILDPSGQWSKDDAGFSAEGRWDDAGPQVIFEGYIVGTGYEQGYGLRRPVVYLTHWLADMAFSSAISNQLQPGGISQFRWNGSWGVGGVNTTDRTVFITDHLANDLFTTFQIKQDFWKECLFAFFGRLAKQDALKLSGMFADDCAGITDKNTSSQQAIARLETSRSGALVVGTDYLRGSSSPYYKPLSMETGATEEQIASAIAEYCMHQTVDEYSGTTLWDKLIADFSPAFGFVVVPRAQTAIIAPLIPGYRTTFDKEFKNGKILHARDFEQLNTSSLLRRPLRGVGVMAGNMTSVTGWYTRTAYTDLGGCFAPDPNAKGMVLFQEPPRWMKYAPAYSNLGVADVTDANPASSMTPKTPADAKKRDTPADITNKSRNYYQAAAQYFYNLEMLRGRSAVISGKLRFDLAPGTNVLIESPGELFLPANKLAQDLVGTIITVSVSLSANPAASGTHFQLDHIRTVHENEDDRFSAENHPFYAHAYTGAPLVDEYLFPEK